MEGFKDGDFVSPPNKGLHGHLTIGKNYKVYGVEPYSTNSTGFRIQDDTGEWLYCLLKNCSHILHFDWRIVTCGLNELINSK
jgi:hypothetical protein